MRRTLVTTLFLASGRLIATEQATLSAPGASCTLILSFNMTREA